MSKQHNMADISISEKYTNDKELFLLRLVELSKQHNAITINIQQFVDLLAVDWHFIQAHHIDCQPITNKAVLQSGLYYIINGMLVYVNTGVEPGHYVIGRFVNFEQHPESEEIHYSSFGGEVSLDLNSQHSGINYPVGTPKYPVNNFADALKIAHSRNFDVIRLKGKSNV